MNISTSRSNLSQRQNFSKKRHSLAGFGSTNSLANFGSSHALSALAGSVPICNCNAELQKEELRKYRVVSAQAIQNSWTEVETLQRTCAGYDQKLDDLSRQLQSKTALLDNSRYRCSNLEEELNILTTNIDPSSPKGSVRSVTGKLQDVTPHQHAKDNIHDHDPLSRNQEDPDQKTRNKEVMRLKQILMHKNSTVDNMEFVLAQNVKMMRTCLAKLQEMEQQGSY